MENNEKLLNAVEQHEKIIIDYVNELKESFGSNSATIDGIEQIMLKTMATLKHSVIAIAEDILNDEGKKKSKTKSMKNVEKR
jgi:hypothetical protein